MALVEVEINGSWVALPSPDVGAYNAYPNIREDSSENGVGSLIRKIIGIRWKIEQSWSQLTDDEYQLLMSLKYFSEFNCKFWCPATKSFLTKKMMAGDITGNGTIQNTNYNITQYSGGKLNFVQTKADKFREGIIL